VSNQPPVDRVAALFKEILVATEAAASPYFVRTSNGPSALILGSLVAAAYLTSAAEMREAWKEDKEDGGGPPLPPPPLATLYDVLGPGWVGSDAQIESLAAAIRAEADRAGTDARDVMYRVIRAQRHRVTADQLRKLKARCPDDHDGVNAAGVVVYARDLLKMVHMNGRNRDGKEAVQQMLYACNNQAYRDKLARALELLADLTYAGG
jgi:hypothetical protein